MSCLNPVYAHCIEFSASLQAKLVELGYDSTNLGDFILEFLITKKGGTDVSSELAKLREEVGSISAANLKVGTSLYGLKSGSVDAAKLQNRNVNYTLVGEELTYDLSSITDNLPVDIKYVGARVDVLADSGKRSSITGKRNVVQVPALPAQAKVTLDLRGPNGNLTLERTIALSTDADKSIPMNVNDLTNAPADVSIQEAIKILSAEVALQKQK